MVDRLPSDPRRRVAFGDFSFGPAERALERAGKPVRLGGRAMDILIALVEQPGQVVSQRDLFARIWPDQAVDASILRVHITTLRKALGEGKGAATRCIINVPGRGYSFVAPISILRSAAPVSDTALVATNLPRPLTALIGRSMELAELAELISAHRLVAILGPGGIGKTRLALELGWQMMSRFADGVRLVDLAPLSRPELVVSAAATALEIMLQGGKDPIETIAKAMVKRRSLVIFDNCEHLLDAVGALIKAMLAQAAGLSIVITSQEPMRLLPAHGFRLEALSIPPAGATEVSGFGAVGLFVERSRAINAHFALNATNSAGIGEICRRLDGIPLSLEMAAARLPVLGLEGLRDGLDERLRLLKATPQASELRYPSLLGMLDWSFGLLDPGDQAVFCRLSVCSGSFSLDAATRIVGGETADRWDMLDALSRLVDKSLLIVDGDDYPRYRLLDTMRLYGVQQLAARGEASDVAERHARYFATLMAQAESEWETTPNMEWMRAYATELDNIRTALDWAFAAPERQSIAMALANTSCHIWQNLGLLSEGMRCIDRAMTLIDPAAPDSVAASLLRRAALLRINSDRPHALMLAQQSLAIYLQLGDDLGRAAVMGMIGGLYTYLRKFDEAEPMLTEAYAILAVSGLRKTLLGTCNGLGLLATGRREPDRARHWYARFLALAQEVGQPQSEGIAHVNLAEIDLMLGKVDSAIEQASAAVVIFRRIGHSFNQSAALSNLTSYLLLKGDLAEARRCAEEAFARQREQGGFILRSCLEKWALLAARAERCGVAARLLGYVDASFAKFGENRGPTEEKINQALLDVLGKHCTADDMQIHTAEGAAWTEGQAVQFASDYIAEGDATT